MLGRACTYQMSEGRACRATPMRDQLFCFWHSPETADEQADAQRLGGLHRRKKRTLATIYGFNGLRTIEDNQALLETVVVETLALENSISRNRTIAGIVGTGAKLLEIGDLAARIEKLEAATRRRQGSDHEEALG